jgi:hypothetical protein
VREEEAPVPADEAAAVDGVGLPFDDEVEQVRVLLGAVFEVRVLDDDDVARRLPDPPPHGRALAAVLLLQDVLESALRGQPRHEVAAAVRGGIVDRDQLDAQRHLQHAVDDLLDRLALVVDRHDHAQERIHERGRPAAAHRRPP